jgi:Toprim-like
VQRDRHLYLPGPRRGVFHWQALKGSEHVVLTESVIDALTLYQAGIRNVSCVYGVQGFMADHEDLLQRFRVKRTTLLLDNDLASSSASRHEATVRGRCPPTDRLEPRSAGVREGREAPRCWRAGW